MEWAEQSPQHVLENHQDCVNLAREVPYEYR